jgi:hypothetical protein
VTAPEYPYPSESSTVAPDSPDVASVAAALRRQVAAELADPTGSRRMVAEVGVDVGNLIDDQAAKAAIGAAADRLHSQAHGE